MSKITNPMTDLIVSGSFGVISATLSLTKAFRQLSYTVVNGKPHEYQTRVTLWIEKQFPNVTSRRRAQERRNVGVALAKDRITFNTFLKGVDILGFTKIYMKMVFLKKNEVNGVYTVNKIYKALIKGEEYAKGDILIYSVACEYNNSNVVYEFWFNKTQRKPMVMLLTLNGLKALNDIQEVDILIPDVSVEYTKSDE